MQHFLVGRSDIESASSRGQFFREFLIGMSKEREGGREQGGLTSNTDRRAD